MVFPPSVFSLVFCMNVPVYDMRPKRLFCKRTVNIEYDDFSAGGSIANYCGVQCVRAYECVCVCV